MKEFSKIVCERQLKKAAHCQEIVFNRYIAYILRFKFANADVSKSFM